MIYLYTSNDQYSRFLSKNNTDRVYKGIKIFTTSKDYLLSRIGINEIFDNKFGLETEYEIINLKTHIKVVFNMKLESYRLDLIPIIENGELINHISFTINDNRFDTIPNNLDDYELFNIDYESPTNRGELIEILNRLNYIIRDLVNKGMNNNFCIGLTEIIKKNDIYKYFLKVIDCEFEKRKTKVYQKTRLGIYFKI